MAVPMEGPNTPKSEENVRKRTSKVAGKAETPAYTYAEVAKHNTEKDVWLVIEDKVYDVTNFLPEHPGGEVLMSHAGADATDVFAAFHPITAYEMLGNYFIGDLKDPKTNSVVREYRALRRKFLEEGLFESSKLYYAFKIISNMAIAGLAAWILYMWGDNIWMVLTSAILMGLFWQQHGWLAHDFLHHQVFKNRKYNELFGGIALGNTMLGFSCSWWKTKHNRHHAVPNIMDNDPDIQTMPLLAWSERFIEGELEGVPQFLVRHQVLFYIPLLFMARFNWCIQSLIWAFQNPAVKYPKFERVAIVLHWVWYLGLLFSTIKSWWVILLYVVISQGVSGLLLGSVFSINHNGMTVFPAETVHSMEFARIQAETGRDVTPSIASDWFTGGLNSQIEHHMYPMLPRHNLYAVRERIVAFCKKNSIGHHTTSFIGGTKETFRRLMDVAHLADKQAK